MTFKELENPIPFACDYCPKGTAEYVCNGEKFCTSCMHQTISDENERRMNELVAMEEDRKMQCHLFGGSYWKL